VTSSYPRGMRSGTRSGVVVGPAVAVALAFLWPRSTGKSPDEVASDEAGATAQRAALAPAPVASNAARASSPMAGPGTGTRASEPSTGTPSPSSTASDVATEPIRQGRFLPVDAEGRPLLGVRLAGASHAYSSPTLFWARGPRADLTSEAAGLAELERATPIATAPFARSISPDWVARAPVTAEGETTVVLDPATWVVVHVVDETETPVARFEVHAWDSSGNGEGFIAQEGGFVMQWRQPQGGARDVDATFMVDARGYAPVVHDLRIPAGRRSSEVRLTMTRTRDATLKVRVPGFRESASVRYLGVQLRLSRHPDWVALNRSADWVDGTVIEARVPPGDWSVVTTGTVGHGRMTLWSGPVSLAPGGEAEFTWAPPVDFARWFDEVRGTAPR
jgi:hypothetical protein